ncbi:hypothetical protein [Corynebacterium jeddahense]|uniref:Uncharacterized protein n=1 Tax=Corynebacterium jeddahense TaxID=1414719 RepID=A0ABY7UPJ2_9CORY|nr:hypothetical protein [Corynebacterium jeddahense]WCZ39705.1 hypothetical protein CJEDD_10675 [Corynebacterium jeddahense]
MRIDDQGKVRVIPGEDVDGPITVTITDPDVPNGKVEVEVPVNGHEKNRDDNRVTVDRNGVHPVNPTEDEQPTGIVVKNPTEGTKATAVDEDGKEVKASIDGDGNVVVTPGTDVDGPITVTIEDPSLPNGKVEVEVPVTGHEKNRDDNGSHTSSVTTPDVPADGQGHTVGRIDNPKKDGGYTGTVVGPNGKEIPGSKVEIDNEGNITVTVPKGTKPGEARVVIKDGNGKTVRDENGDDLRINVIAPEYGADATQVKPGAKGTTKDPFADQTVNAPIEKTGVTPSKGADNWAFTIDDKGAITGQAPSETQLQDSFKQKFPNGTTSWDDFKKQFEGIAEPTATGSITLSGVKDPLTGDAKFELVGKDGKSILDPTGDFDGDGVSNIDEIKGGSDPFNKASTPKGEDKPTSEPKPTETPKPGLTDDERNRCIATSVGFGLPLLLLIPIGLATQTAIPGLTPIVEQYSEQIRLANARIQQQMGIFNEDLALQVEAVNSQLRQFGLDVATVGAGLALIAAGILSGTIIYDNCTPGGGSSAKNLELKGSSGKTYTKVESTTVTKPTK